jgi:hypothetical protein
MDCPVSFGSFWSCLILPKKPCKVTIPLDAECSLTNLALDQDDAITSGRVVVSVSVNDSPPVAIMPFTVGRFESSAVDLRFSGEDRIVFTTSGAELPVHISGYLDGAFCPEVDNGVSPVAE